LLVCYRPLARVTLGSESSLAAPASSYEISFNALIGAQRLPIVGCSSGRR